MTFGNPLLGDVLHSRQWRLIVLLLSLLIMNYGAPIRAQCNATIPVAFRLPKIQAGRDYTVCETKMDAARDDKDLKLFESLFRQHVKDYNNISGSIIQFPSHRKHVYRSAMLAYSPDTLKELMLQRGVKSIFHLSNTKTVNQKLWIKKEKEIFSKYGGNLKNYTHILDFSDVFNNKEERFAVQKKVSEIIKKIEASEGNVLIHCLGGQHKTEIIFETMQKCYNKVNMKNIIERYKCHTAWSNDPVVKTGYKRYRQSNIDFIEHYPCVLLETVNYPLEPF